MRSPKYQLRMDQGLYDALTKAGSTRVREALQQAFPVLPGSTQDTSAVVPEAVVVVPAKRAVVPKVKPVVPDQPTVLPDRPTEDPAEVPAWLAKLNADRDRIAQDKERKDAERRAAEAVKLGTT